MRRSLLVRVAVAASLLFGLASCGDDETADPVDCEVIAPVDGITRVEMTAENMSFDVGCIQLQPGPVEFTFHNEDSGVSHNLRVEGHGVDEATELERGDVTQVLEVELTELGDYEFACDPHPNMKGTIQVVDPAAEETPSTTG